MSLTAAGPPHPAGGFFSVTTRWPRGEDNNNILLRICILINEDSKGNSTVLLTVRYTALL